MSLDEWVAAVPQAMREEAIWKVRAYQIGSYLGSCAATDAKALAGDVRWSELAPQLVRAVGSIAANVAEGYSRRSR